MSIYDDLRFDINDKIKLNGLREITGTVLNAPMIETVDVMEARDIKSFNQESSPIGTVIGDFWYKPSTNALYRWTGSAWELYDFTGNVPVSPVPPQDWVDYNPQASVPPQLLGRSWFDLNSDAFSVFGDLEGNEVSRLGRQLRTNVINGESFNLVPGHVVKIVGLNGDIPVVKLAQANSIESARTTIGMIKGTILPGENGILAILDDVINVDTSLLQVNDSIFLDPHVAGGFTAIEPSAPHYAVAIGFVGVVSVTGAVAVRFGGFQGNDTGTNAQGIINNIITQTHNVDIDTDGVNIWADVTNEVEPTENLPFMMNEKLYYLDTTTNTGAGGAARVIIPPGASATEKQVSFVYIELVGEVPTLKVATTEPNLAQIAKVCRVVAFDATRTQSDGRIFGYRRINNAITNNGQGLIEDALDNIREKLGSNWTSGQDATTTIDNTQIRVALTAGQGRQFRRSSTPLFDGLNYLIFNDNSNQQTYAASTNLIDISETALGETLNTNCYYNIRLFYHLNSNGFGNDIIATRPLGKYSNIAEAVLDVSNFTVNVNDVSIEEEIYPLYDVVIQRSGGGSTITLAQLTDLRTKIAGGIGGGGASGGGGTDDKVRISATDTTNDYLGAKIVAGDNITLTTLNPGANETIEVSSAASAENIYRGGFWWSLLNKVDENILADNLNRTQIYLDGSGTVTKIQIRIDDIGTNPNGVAINFIINGLDLLTSNYSLSQGLNELTVFQNNTFTDNQEIQLAVRIGSGDDNIGDGYIKIFTE